MVAERAGYTVTMFLIDVSKSMGNFRTVTQEDSKGENVTIEMTNLEWSLQFVKLKIQEMIFNGRKTDQCGVIIFGSEETKNIVNTANGGYENVFEYISIGQPNAGTIAKLDKLEASSVCGDPIDALIVGIETQARYLANKKTWTRKVVIVTDGESPIEIEDWEATVKKMDDTNVSLTIVGVDFDDEELEYEEPDKSNVKRVNEKFFHELTSTMANGITGSCAYALRETAMPDIKQTRSALLGTVLRLGDVDTRGEEAIELTVKASKCTATARPKSWKKFGLRERTTDEMDQTQDDEDAANARAAYAMLKMRSEYYVDRTPGEEDEDGDVKMKREDDDENLLDAKNDDEDEDKEVNVESMEKVEKEDLIRGFKYGTTYAPCPDGQFPRLHTRKGIDICGFFPKKNFRRELSMGEIQYIWGDPSSPQQQVALSSIVQAMYEKGSMAIARWVSRDGMDPKMGVLYPVPFDNVDCLIWAQMPFADDVRKYTFPSLTNLINKKGETLTEHPYLPTDEQMEAMDKFVDTMDLMEAGDKDEKGNRLPWFSTLESFNPAIHRVKQAMFHSAITGDITTNPLPPPHPELLKFFEPPKRVVRRSKEALEECKQVFKVKEVPKKVVKAKKEGHVHAQDDDDSILLLDRKQPSDRSPGKSQSQIMRFTQVTPTKNKAVAKDADDSETEDEDDEEMLLDQKKPSTPAPEPRPGSSRNPGGGPLPTPARSMSPEVDPGRAPGRIVGNTYPLQDFQKNISQGDVVSKAVEDLGQVIIEVVLKPFAKRRHSEMLECMEIMRKTCLEEDEIDAWNIFIRELREKCLAKPGNKTFWQEICALGLGLGLISKHEAKKHLGESNVTQNEANEFIST
ncbi:ku80-like protein [Crepidotus variabilis]|uniref:ATP-dependent DNA helicase II subunit 2 n=1 Tax=Crepidotus variabilis TaxID=179855 RepID=A0A9P6E8Z3_9AGAR|nr:ku80-like protein [Crepidotus variabilis]